MLYGPHKRPLTFAHQDTAQQSDSSACIVHAN
jgi:hypothetical protein